MSQSYSIFNYCLTSLIIVFFFVVQSEKVILSASNIKNVGVQGAYTHTFLAMEKILEDVQELLKSTNISAQELATTENLITPLRKQLTEATEKLNETGKILETTEQQIKWVDLDLNDLKAQMNNLVEATKHLKGNATKLQEANVEGWYPKCLNVFTHSLAVLGSRAQSQNN